MRGCDLRHILAAELCRATLTAAVTDAYGNARTDAVAYTLGDPAGVATLDGASVAAADVGSVYAYARAGAASSYGGAPVRVVVMDSSGGSPREVGLPPGVASVSYPRLLADGTVLVVGREPAQYSPTYTPSAAGVYSIKVDGTATKLAALPSASTLYGAAAVSPDGSRVAFVVDPGGYGQAGALKVLTIAGGQVTQVAASASSPAWSPSGDRLAYLAPPAGYSSAGDGTLATVNPDGSAPAAVAGAPTFSPGLAWSPNGAYVLGRSAAFGEGLRVVRVRDGASVLLRLPAVGSSYGGVADYYQPDWR